MLRKRSERPQQRAPPAQNEAFSDARWPRPGFRRIARSLKTEYGWRRYSPARLPMTTPQPIAPRSRSLLKPFWDLAEVPPRVGAQESQKRGGDPTRLREQGIPCE